MVGPQPGCAQRLALIRRLDLVDAASGETFGTVVIPFAVKIM